MKFLIKISLVWAVLAIFLIGGCAGQKALTTVKKPMTQKLSMYNVLKIDPFTYDPSVKIDDPAKATELINMLQADTKFKIYELSLFEKIVDTEPTQATDRVVVLKGRVTYMKRLTKATRILFGAMAGRSGVAVSVQMVDQATQSVLGEADIQGTSSGGSVFAGTTEEAFGNTTQQIADFVKTHY